ncbi:MAG TPA: CarD family transcriptional regulator, partial [Gemmatimonadaceae bacterium]|nr:CarD family transcriptional regulator [Gemmatimonadaceae bacterium]
MGLPTLLDAVERLPAFTRLLNDLPGARSRREVVGLAGSSDAAMVAALARRLPTRFVVVLTDGLPDAERWLADLQALLDAEAVALYPPREGFGEVEPHAEVAGERVETLERVGMGGVRILLTTARAIQERTRLPGALQGARLELRKGDVRRPTELAQHLEDIGFERVPMVEDVAQFSVRGGIFDIYGFGMSAPVRLEFWGDEVVELRHFELVSQRATRAAEVALVLPVDGRVSDHAESFERIGLADLWPPDTLVVVPGRAHLAPEMERTWEEAAHHIELARRRGEDVPRREELFQPPASALAAVRAFGTIALGADGEPGDVPESIAFPIRPPEAIDRDIKRLKRILRDGTPSIILCDNSGQAERLEELLGDEEWPTPAALAIGVLDGGFVIPPVGQQPGLRVLTDHEIFRRERRIRRARRYGAGVALETITALKPGDYVVHLEHGIGIYRGIERIFVREATIEVAVLEYEGGDRLNVPLYRIDQIERYRAAGEGDGDAPAPRLHKLGGKRWAQQRDKTRAAIQEMTVELLDLYARRQIATRPQHVPDSTWQRQLESSFLFE